MSKVELKKNKLKQTETLEKARLIVKENGESIVATLATGDLVFKNVGSVPLVHFKDGKGDWNALVRDSEGHVLNYRVDSVGEFDLLSASKDEVAQSVASFLRSGTPESEWVLSLID